ncbi:MAG TPA: M43 family zinc metalloprotease [Chitinophagales bacterium]|nr:M43 family zinc metalloprotease [Chitinophagales bacterium]
MRYILLFILLMQSMLVSAQRTCGAEILHQIKLKNDPTLINKEEEIENFVQKYTESRAGLKADLSEEMIIPIVFHVVYFREAQNILEERILEQIEVLNQDFNALNSDINNVPGPFQSAIGKLNIKFVLANRDPDGNPTTGINRVKTSKSTAFDYIKDDVKSNSQLGVNAWDTKSYLNIWVCDIKDYSASSRSLLGYATFPSSAGRFDDGVVLNYRHVGKPTSGGGSFNLGRTATHELGHYFNLRHIWGDADNCRADDGVADTPKQLTSSSGSPRFPKTDECSNSYPGIMFMNYMDYSNDAALLMFTNNQATRMAATMSGPRASLLTSKGYVNATDYDVAISKINSPNTSFLCDNAFTPSVKVVSLGKNPVTTFKVDFIVNDIAYQTATWTGLINLNGVVNVVFNPVTIENGSYTVKYKVYATNEQDLDPSNDSKSVSVKVGTDSKSLPFTESFESINIATNGFVISNPDNAITWSRSSSNASTDGKYSIFMNNAEYDPSLYSNEYGVFDDIIFPFINLKNYNQATMTFDLAACQYTELDVANNNWDTLQVLVSVDCGQTFNVIYSKYAGELITVPPSTSFFKPNNINQWRTESLNLSEYTGQDNVLLKIRNISHFENNIYIDNLKINGTQVTSVKDAISDVYIQLYPNPTKGNVSVRIDQNVQSLKRIEWMNTLGQTIQVPTSGPISNFMQFDFSNQVKGIYIAHFIFEDGTVNSKKLILN